MLTFLYHHSRDKASRRYNGYECACGRKRVIREDAVKSGHVKSCGCLKYTALRKSQEGAYVSYRAMLRRCYDIEHENYPAYGGAGVHVYFDWLGKDGFKNFYAEMGDRPEGKTLDRILNSVGYEPGNCRWASAKAQRKNQRRNKNG